ncbi:MAG: hypothetical protein ABI164_04765 [Acidobacteriaceae bacterium]
MIKRHALQTSLVCCVVLLAAGCSKTDNSKANFKTAIDNYYGAHPACLWQDAKKFPVQATTSDEAKTEGFDALTDTGLLTRTTAEKKVFILGSKQVNNYDVSDKGRSVWTQDPTQPGYGNFCYGHRQVTSIDNFTSTVNASGTKTAHVNYHFTVGNVADWAESQEMKTAFPMLNETTGSSQPGEATLVMNGNNWQMAQ